MARDKSQAECKARLIKEAGNVASLSDYELDEILFWGAGVSEGRSLADCFTYEELSEIHMDDSYRLRHRWQQDCIWSAIEFYMDLYMANAYEVR